MLKIARAFRTVSLFLVPLLVSCGHFSKSDDGEYITIGALFPLSGDYCHEGIRAFNGLRLARQEINEAGGVLGKRLDIIILDDRGDPRYAVEQYNALKRRGAVAVIGSSFPDVSLAIARAAERDGMPVISPMASEPEITAERGNVFRLMPLDSCQVKALAFFARDRLGARTALIISGGPGHKSASDIFEATFGAGGGSVARERYGTAGDFDSILAKYRSKPPDIIFSPADYIDAARLAEAVHRAGFAGSKLIGTNKWDGILAFLREYEVMDRVYYASPFAFDDANEEVTRFFRAYWDEFRSMPLASSALSYSAVQVLVSAIERAGGTGAQEIVAAINTAEANTIIGNVGYGGRNELQNTRAGIYIMQVKNRHYSSVEKIGPPEAAR